MYFAQAAFLVCQEFAHPLVVYLEIQDSLASLEILVNLENQGSLVFLESHLARLVVYLDFQVLRVLLVVYPEARRGINPEN